MRRARILAAGLSDQEVAAISGLARQAGFAADELDIVQAVTEPIVGCDDELLIVMLTPGVCEEPQLEGELINAHRGGARRAIFAWPPGADSQTTPPVAVLKYAYSIVSWNADKLRLAAADDDFLCFETPAGEPLSKVPVERNLCVDEEAK